MSRTPGWEEWERELQQLFGLDSTTCSGNKFNDIGDATDNTSPRDSGFRLLVDGKYTDGPSWPLPLRMVRQWLDTAAERGKRGLVAIRVWPRGQFGPRDYVVLDANDFAELYEKARLYDQVIKAHLKPGDVSIRTS